LTCVTAITLFAALATSIQMAAQQPRYTVTDLGTLGGSFSVALGNSNNGLVTGLSSLLGDQNAHAFLWRHGVRTDLGTLGGPDSIPAFAPPNERGEVGGGAETSTPDPNEEDFCGFGTHLTCLPFVWQDGVMTALPTLGGNNGIANQINNRGKVAGAAESTTQLPPCLQGLATPVVWEKGVIQELPMFPGDLAGVARAINDKGQAAGFTAGCRDGHALLWQNGTATDLGNLGGTFSGAEAINNQGKVVGFSHLPGDTTSHAFLWQDGVITDLGKLPGDIFSVALGINNEGQVVGDSFGARGERPFLWENGVMTDLNALIPAASSLILIDANGINSRGEIAGIAFQISTDEFHAYLAIPNQGSNSGTSSARSEARQTLKITLPEKVRKLLQQRMGQWYHIHGLGASPRD